MKRTASAAWSGDLKSGKGSVSTQSGILKDTQYGFGSRFEEGPGTNPEELIAAAHAGCFTMATAAALGKAGFTAESLATAASLTLDQVEGNWTITAIHLDLKARVPGISAEQFQEVFGLALISSRTSHLSRSRVERSLSISTRSPSVAKAAPHKVALSSRSAPLSAPRSTLSVTVMTTEHTRR